MQRQELLIAITYNAGTCGLQICLIRMFVHTLDYDKFTTSGKACTYSHLC